MVSCDGVKDIVSTAHFGHVESTVWAFKDACVPMLSATEWVEERAVENDVAALNINHGRVETTEIASINALEVEFLCHASGTSKVLMRLTVG